MASNNMWITNIFIYIVLSTSFYPHKKLEFLYMEGYSDVIMFKQKSYSLFGLLSLSLGIFNIIISIIIFWALWSFVNGKYPEIIPLQINILHIFGRFELYIKFLGLLLGIVGFIQKNTRKDITIIALIVNSLIILWTIALRLGFII